jgi:hypothetical protein
MHRRRTFGDRRRRDAVALLKVSAPEGVDEVVDDVDPLERRTDRKRIPGVRRDPVHLIVARGPPRYPDDVMRSRERLDERASDRTGASDDGNAH